jgi:hypothetical protein
MIADYANTISFLLDNFQAVNGVVAHPTQSQGNGQVTYGFSRVTTVATAGDALTLPTAKKDAIVAVYNDQDSRHATLWPDSGDQLDDHAVDESVTLSPKQLRAYIAIGSLRWFSIAKTPGVDASVTAFAGGGQGSATLLANQISRIDTVATNGDSVKLPPARVGDMRAVYNDDSAQYAEIFPNTSDAINDLGANNGIILSPNSSVIFYCLTPSLWNTYARDLPFVPGLTAFAGGGQGNLTLTNGYTRISVVATNGDSVDLPPAYLGNHCELINTDTGQYVAVYPSSGDSIDGLGVNNPLYLFPGQTVEFNATGATEWYTKPSPIAGVLGVVAAGTVIGDATQLIADWNIVSASVAGVTDGIALPRAIVGRRPVFIHNDDAGDAVKIYPFNDGVDQIDDNAPGASISLAVNATIVLRAISANKWRSNIT